jgi:hypothetical protein
MSSALIAKWLTLAEALDDGEDERLSNRYREEAERYLGASSTAA